MHRLSFHFIDTNIDFSRISSTSISSAPHRRTGALVLHYFLSAQSRTLLEHKNPPESDSPQNPPSPNDGNVFELILGSKNLPHKEKSRKRITEEAFDLLIAGGETTSRMWTVIPDQT